VFVGIVWEYCDDTVDLMLRERCNRLSSLQLGHMWASLCIYTEEVILSTLTACIVQSITLAAYSHVCLFAPHFMANIVHVLEYNACCKCIICIHEWNLSCRLNALCVHVLVLSTSVLEDNKT